MLMALMTLIGCKDGAGCWDVYGPEGVSVGFSVTDADATYTWTLEAEDASLSCTLPLVGGTGDIDCDESFSYNGPAPAEGGGYSFSTSLETAVKDASVHVTFAQDGASLVDEDFDPDWTPVEEEGNCAEFYQAEKDYDLR